MNKLIEQAETCIMTSQTLSIDLIRQLAGVPGEDVLELAALANRVRNRFAPSFQACSIINARSGSCSENCRFCAQSAAHKTAADNYPLLGEASIMSAAETAYASGVRSFCIVASGYGTKTPSDDFNRILNIIDAIHNRWPDMGVSASLGILSDETARMLSEHRIEHYNINLQTSPDRYADLIATTHSIEERRATIRLLKKYGIQVCSGGILGVGETMDDRIALARAVGELKVEIIPLNVLVPIPGTPLEHQPQIPAIDVVRTVAIFRLLNPRAVIKLAAGRETVMNDFQGLLMLAGANGFITGGYLTTRGRDVARDMAFLKQLRDFAATGAASKI